jgi:hypothetical protein
MAMWVKVRNINPIGAVLTFVDGERREVGAGEVIEVSPEQAGQGPRWRQVADGEVVESHQESREHAGHLEVRDLGNGLLAQESNWEAVADEKPAETEKENS